LEKDHDVGLAQLLEDLRTKVRRRPDRLGVSGHEDVDVVTADPSQQLTNLVGRIEVPQLVADEYSQRQGP